ncbi:SGNH/GDSL hydrolase family protein [Rhizobium pisi]|uniref:SGNH/GDSL hydrolase family protein n=1 Tax=Rhizobium pisi TaxID=574561 RepID=UPI0013F179AA|nr:SGNH/GDSL hydrolase family protein [Rhizobium pisi]
MRFDRTGSEDFRQCTPGARYRIQTDATQITFNTAYNNQVTRYDSRNYIASIFVNGALHSSFNSFDGVKVITFPDVTSRLIELIWPYADGMDLLKTTVNVGANFFGIPSRPNGIYVAAGDSITQGFWSSKTVNSWAFKSAVAINRRLINLGDGGDIAVASYANALIGTGADRVSYMIGYNNFAAQTALATFQAAVEGWINNAKAALPSAKILVISPIYSPNTNTITLAQYRTSVAAAVTAAGGANVSYVNGLSLMTNSNDRLVDGVHPTDTGALEIVTNLAPLLAA